MSGADLSASVGRLGRAIPVLGIQRIEAGTRRVDVDDLVVIAVALGVSPASLLMPLRQDAADSAADAAVPKPGDSIGGDDLVPIAGWNQGIPARIVWGWLTAEDPLIEGTILSLYDGWPVWEQEAFRDRMREAQKKLHRSLYRKVPEGDIPEDIRRMLEESDGNDQ